MDERPALVSRDGRYHTDVLSAPLYAERFLAVSPFSEGSSAVRDGSGAYHIGYGGKPLYRARFLETYPFSAGLAASIFHFGEVSITDLKKELREKGNTDTYEEVLRDVIQRDYDDSHRAIAPLRQAEDAVLADTSELDLEESIQLLLNIVKERQ